MPCLYNCGLNQAASQKPGTLPVLSARCHEQPISNRQGASFSETHREFFGRQCFQIPVL
jgi:hypothetical protein